MLLAVKDKKGELVHIASDVDLDLDDQSGLRATIALETGVVPVGAIVAVINGGKTK